MIAARRIRAAVTIVLSTLVLLGASREARAQLVINEIDYDQPSTDTAEFIELENVGSTVEDLSAYSLRLVNGANNTVYATYPLPPVNLEPGAYFVVCANAANVPNCNHDVSPDTNLIQNGNPDAVALLLGSQIVDTISYGGAVPGYTEGGAATTDSSSLAEQGLSRCPDGGDTQNNATDFAFRPISPGEANSCAPGGGGPAGACGDPATRISAIQGSGTDSPLVNQTVTVEAVVVGDFQTGNINGFFLQEEDGDQDGDPATSEGLFVYEGSSAAAVSVGQLVRVRGRVAEFQSDTELDDVSDVVVCPGTPVASAEELTFPVPAAGWLERLEGMRVHIGQSLTVTGNFELGRFGSLDLSAVGRLWQPTEVAAPGPAALAVQDQNGRSRIILDDASFIQNPNPIPYKDASQTRRTGDTLPSLDGVIDGRLGARIYPVGPLAFQASNPRPSAAPVVGGRLRVASFNVLNFFTTIDTGQLVCGPSGGLECRGADSAAELSRQRTKLCNALLGMQADVFGLIELENNAQASAQSLVDCLNAQLGAGSYAFVDTGTIGTDAIKLAYLYRVAAVAPVGAFALLTSAVNPAFLDSKNRPALAQTWQEVSTGERFTSVLNHLKSKGSSCSDVGDPDQNDGQGNCNATRTAAAGALRDWIASDPTGSGDRDFMILGDLNSYRAEDPIAVLTAAQYTPAVERFASPPGYSYQFDGQSGHLDHLLVNPPLLAQVTGAAEWHINADEPVVLDYNTEFKTDDPFNAADVFRASDHDPVVVGLDLAPAAPRPVPALPGPAAALLAGGLLAIAAKKARSR